MSTLSVPLAPEQEKFIKDMAKTYRSNKAAIVRRAIDRLAEEEAVNVVLQSEQDLAAGHVFRGDLKKLLKKIK